VTDGNTPALSIVIPAYNVAPYVRQAVESALDQRFTDIEVIVVDDGSTDGTDAVLADIEQARADPRLRIIRQPNAGLSGARNTGIAAARADLIGFLDGDDAWLPEKAARHVAAMRANPDIGLSFSHSAYMTEAGEPTEQMLLAEKSSPNLHDMIRRNHVGNGSSAVVRRACLVATGPFNTDLRACEDYEMWCRMLNKTSCRAELVPAPLTLYRMRHASLSYDADKFTHQAEAAMLLLRAAMPLVPRRVFDEGQAQHYRIAAWKAATSGASGVSARLLLKALRMQPALLFRDRRLAVNAVWLALPQTVRARLWGRAPRGPLAVDEPTVGHN
jgi:glycosyltransferase involved in cell wall biosynthesis